MGDRGREERVGKWVRKEALCEERKQDRADWGETEKSLGIYTKLSKAEVEYIRVICVYFHVCLNVWKDKCNMPTKNILKLIYSYLKLNSCISSCREYTLMERHTFEDRGA